MKKNFLTFIVLAFCLTFTSCKSSSGSFESDVKKMANYRCEMQQLMAKDMTDEKVKKELDDLTKEMTAYAEEMSKKYDKMEENTEMEAKADAIMKEVMEKCK